MSTKTLPATDVIGLSSDVKRAAVLPFSDIFCWKTRYASHSMETTLRSLALITVLNEAESIMVENCRTHVTECRVSRKSSTAITLSECLNISHQHATNNSGLITFPDLHYLLTQRMRLQRVRVSQELYRAASPSRRVSAVDVSLVATGTPVSKQRPETLACTTRTSTDSQ